MKLPVQDLKKGGKIWGLEFIDWRKSYATNDQLSVVYKKGSNSTDEQMENGGIEIVFAPPTILPSATSAMLGCKIKYPTNFNFTRGGKTGLGFAIGTGSASGGRRSTNASSARIMWRSNGAASLYVYVPKDLHQIHPELNKSAFGDGWGVEFFLDVFGKNTLKRGTWNDLSIRVILNTFAPGGYSNPDGICVVTINGESASLGGVRWLSSPEKINSVPFNTFFGGEEWSAAKDETVLYSDFWISD
ncbi:hypothetical protein PBCVNEJV1_272L [Paramecium bursaria Chlorella virus NE-JV-1]|nr:hypothetical protein PBCVNEJV1_272L [Paramecium bursaria Chlorella virus NE-JV-1]